MTIIFKGEYKFQERLLQFKLSYPFQSGQLCLWTMSREPMDSVDIVQSAWTLSMVTVENVYTFHRVHG